MNDMHVQAMPWVKSYPAGVAWNAHLETGPVQDILEGAARTWPDRPALDFAGRIIGYAELDHLANQMAAGLQSLGVGPGVHVGIYLPNTPHYFIAFFAILKAGGVVVNYSPLDAAAVLAHKVEDSETDFLFTLDMKALFPQMHALLGGTRLRGLIVGSYGDYSANPGAIAAGQKATGDLVDVSWGEAVRRFSDLLVDGSLARHKLGDPAQAIAVLQYTGGTTGLPKGAILTHANLTAATSQILETTRTNPPVLTPGHERSLAVLPPFHVYALVVNMLMGIKLGGELVLHARFDLAAVLADLSAKHITIFCGVPTMYVGLLQAELASFDLSSLRLCNSGGAPLPLEIQQRFQSATGTSLNEGWGMTETSAIGSFTPAQGVRHPGSCGIPAPGIDFHFLDINDPARVLPLGERGEIAIRGPNVMQGYWKNPEATAQTFTTDGYLRTGDVGWMDEDGYVYIVDRTKDMLLCGGFNVYPRVIEEAIYAHPGVAEVAVIGVADEYRGQAPKAFIKLRPDAPELSLEELRTFLKPRIGKHEMVSAVQIVEALPRTPVGKIDKKPLCAMG